MRILDNRDRWLAEFRAGWLAHYRETGTLDWKRYPKIRNDTLAARPGCELERSRLGLISTAGGYRKGHQAPFDAANPLGDYSIRALPMDLDLALLAYAHDHFDHAAVEADPQVLLPLAHLKDIETEGGIGSLAPDVISFMGYQPDVIRVVDETAAAVVEHAEEQGWDAALLVPS